MISCQEVLRSALRVGSILSIVLQRSENRVREAKTLAHGHTAGQCPRPSWDQGCLTLKVSCGVGRCRFQRWWSGFGDDEDQVLGLVAEVEGRAREWMRPEAGLSGSSGPCGQQVCSEWPLFMPGEEELSLRRRAWTGRQRAGRVQPSWVPSDTECLFGADLVFRNRRGPGSRGEKYLLVWGQRRLSPVPKCCFDPTCPAAST